MAIITISRQTGSKGDQVAAQVAGILGVVLIDREIIAEQAGVPAIDHSLERVFGQHPAIDDRIDWLRSAAGYLDSLVAAIREAADKDVVILGRGAQVVLRDRSDAVHVKVIAPFEARVVEALRSGLASDEYVEAHLRGCDERRAAFHRDVFGVDWEDPDLYDLVLNTGRTGIEGAVAAVVHCARARGLVNEHLPA